MKYDTAKIVEAIKAAVAAAKAADRGDDADGGTCNFDSAYIPVPSIREKQAKEIIALVPEGGVTLGDYSFHGRVLMLHCYHGQANRRTIMAEAASKAIQALGMKASMYYQMD
jgi:hypothetical protein